MSSLRRFVTLIESLQPALRNEQQPLVDIRLDELAVSDGIAPPESAEPLPETPILKA